MFDNVNFGTPDGGTPAYVTDNTDCDDTDAAVNPSVAEIPGNGIDDDCDTVIDTGIPCYPDADLDTYGDTSSPTSDPDGVCDAPLISDGTDCDDTDALINPGAYDVAGDAIDQDCNGIDAIFCYPDADLDGYGNVISTPTTDADGSCDVGFANNNTDCDDQRNDINPGQPDPSQDGIDQDCDGGDGPEGIYVKPHPPDAAPIVSVNPALSGEGGNASFFLYGVLR